MIRALDVLADHPEHRMTTLDQLICFLLAHAPGGLTTLSLIEMTGASTRYLDSRLTALTRAGIVQRGRRTSKSGRRVTIFTLGESGDGLPDVADTCGEGSAAQIISPRKVNMPGEADLSPVRGDI